MIEETAKLYHDFGLSVIPVGENKIPIGSWKPNIKKLIAPNGNFTTSFGIGIVCGVVSSNLEVIDIDCKYDLTGKLFEDYKNLIAAENKELLKKLVVEKTPSGGYHFIYRCTEIAGNTKLAQRHASESELLNDKNRYRVLIETRGEGGYTMVAPSPKYTLVYRNFTEIVEITPQERRLLFDCARTLHQVYEQPVKEHKKTNGISCFDAYNERADILQLLETHGWKAARRHGAHIFMLRPGGKGAWSADWHEEKRLLYVWTTSTEFENDKAYNPSQILTILDFARDYSKSSKWLYNQGYGEKVQYKRGNEATGAFNPREALPKFDEVSEYLESVRNGTFQLGLSTGIKTLDEYFRFKYSSLVIFNGHDNVGKSTTIWYLATLSAMLHNWNWIIHAGENKVGGVYRKLIEFYLCKPLKDLPDEEYLSAFAWVKAHFKVIGNLESYTHTNVLNIADEAMKEQSYQGLLIDPYNSLFRDKNKTENVHDYDYEALGEMRQWINTRKCSIYINCHAQTEALRRVFPKGHEHEGLPMPPGKADTEGGGKFSNRSDDFITIHRMTQHPSEWMFTEIHVRKVKEMETGGRPTLFNQPVKLKMLLWGIGFEDSEGYNAVTKKHTYQFEYSGPSKPIAKNDFYEKQESDNTPF